MKANYDFKKARRGAVLSVPSRKLRITIRLDQKIVAWFRSKVESQGGGNYQSMINEALLSHIDRHEQPFEDTIRRVLREELRKAS